MEISKEDLRKFQGEYVEMRHSSMIYYELKTQLGKDIQKQLKEGVSLRIVDKGRLKFAHSSDPATITDKIRSVEWNPLSEYTVGNPIQHYEKRPNPMDLPVEEVKKVIETIKNIKAVKARLESLTRYEHIVTNLGTDVCHGSSKLFVRVFLTPIDNITISYSFGHPGANVIKKLEQLENPDLYDFTKCHAISSGRYDVVLSPQATGAIFHEIAHSFEGSVPEVPRFPSFISVSDNQKAKRLGGYTHDSEGCKSTHIPLITKGVVQNCLASIFIPGYISPTGNGRASSFDVQPMPRQSNLEVTAHTGRCTEEELLEMAHNGVYLSQIGGGSMFPGGITYFTDTVAYRIENGELKEPIKNINFGGNLIDMVNNIQYMGDNYKVEPAVCWKNNQRLYVSTKAPSSLINGMVLSCHNSSKS